MSKKKKNKEKQLLKQQAKLEREKIASFYLDKINDLLDEGYIEMNQAIDEFNEKLIESTLIYNQLKNDLILFVKKDQGIEKLEQITQRAIEFEKNNASLYLSIVSRNIKENKILRLLDEISKKVRDVIEKAQNELNGKKNSYYITSLIINRSYKQFENYNEYITDIALESNCYLDAFCEAREGFIDFITEIKDNAEASLQKTMIEQIDDGIKYKERLRVSYYELEKFLIYKGYTQIRQNSTTHAIWKHEQTGISVTVPNKSRTMPQGTVSKILRIIKSNRQELANFLHN